MKKRFLQVLLTGAVLLTLLGGCGKKKGEGEEGEDSTQVVDAMIEKYTPLVQLPEYKGVEYTPQVTEVTDDMVESRMQQFVSSLTETQNLTEGEARMGDTVNIDFVGYIDGEAFSGGDTLGQGTNIVLGESGYIDNFDEQIAGHKPGDTFDVNVTFPEGYGNLDLAGRAAVFETTLNYIVESNVPELTDELVAANTDYDTIEAYRASVKDELIRSYAESDEDANKESLLNIVKERCIFSGYPEEELEARVQQTVEQYASIAEANDMSFEQLLSVYAYDEETFQQEVRQAVESYMKEKIAVAAIAGQEGITVTASEKDLSAQALAAQYNLTSVDDLSLYGFTDDDLYFMELEKKVLQVLYDNAATIEQ